MGDGDDSTKRMKDETNAGVTCLNRKVVHIHVCDWVIGLSDIKMVEIVNLESLVTENDVTVLQTRKGYTDVASRNELDGPHLLKI